MSVYISKYISVCFSQAKRPVAFPAGEVIDDPPEREGQHMTPRTKHGQGELR